MRWTFLLAGLWLLAACARASGAGPAPLPGETASPPTPATASPSGTLSVPQPTVLPDEPPPPGASAEFSTDFSRHSVPYGEILSGGPPKDGIPALDHPAFVTVPEADGWLANREPVIFFRLGDDARAYPIQILIWHEIVNDVVNDTPVLITFCPLCNTAIAFERTVNGQVLDFGTTGRLRYSNLIMYDRQTESWWQQATGEAIVGEMTGTRLTFLPASIIAWEDFRDRYPAGRVLDRDTGFSRPYGSNPYVGYDSVDATPFLFRGPPAPDAMPPMARVLAVEAGDEAVAFPYETMRTVHVANETVGGQPVVVFWAAGVVSPLDSGSTATGRDVGTALAYRPVVDGQTLTFTFDGRDFRDAQTDSRWDAFGRALSGPLSGAQLEPVVAINHFWFSWAAFRPDTRVFDGGAP